MADEDPTDDHSSEFPESSQDEAKPTDDTTASEDQDYEKDMKSPSGILEIVNTIYNDRYYWDILKSSVVFILALKVARECNMMRIPIKEYKPFNRC